MEFYSLFQVNIPNSLFFIAVLTLNWHTNVSYISLYHVHRMLYIYCLHTVCIREKYTYRCNNYPCEFDSDLIIQAGYGLISQVSLIDEKQENSMNIALVIVPKK